MDMNTINGILRAIIPALVAFAAGKGWISTTGATAVSDAIVSAAVAVAAAGWSVKTNLPPKP